MHKYSRKTEKISNFPEKTSDYGVNRGIFMHNDYQKVVNDYQKRLSNDYETTMKRLSTMTENDYRLSATMTSDYGRQIGSRW